MTIEISSARTRLLKTAAEELQRKKEPLRVYRPTRQQMPVHTSKAHELIVRGGKRSGKSTSVSMEFASRILGVPICDPDGNPIDQHWRPPSAEEPGLYWVIGWDWRHIGETIHRLLFEPGMGKGGKFRVIKDKRTQQWRVFNSADPEDKARYKESELAPPLIPPRYIVENSMKYKAAGVKQIESVELHHGNPNKPFAKICFYPSSGDNPKQGDAVSGIWIDEDIQNGDFLKEWQDRLTDNDGWLLWSVWPHDSNFALVNLLDRANEEAVLEEPDIQAVQLLMTQNEYIPEKGKIRSLKRMESEEEIASRDRGDLPADRMMFDLVPAIHVIDSWKDYDPSNTRTAVLSGVVPPPVVDGITLGDRLIIEWEVIACRTSNVDLARLLEPLMLGFNYESFVIDQMAGRQTHAGRDDNTSQHYEKAFRERGLSSRQTGNGFAYGCAEPQVRFRVIREMMAAREDYHATLLLIEKECQATLKEFRTYRKKQQKKGDRVEIYDEPSNPRVHDCMQTLEYLAEHVSHRFEAGTAYVDPNEYSRTRGGSAAYHAAQRLLKEMGKQGGYVHLGPGNAA
jgi:hypothetical protein